MNELDLAYIAGFFDGEGNAAIRQVKATNSEKRYPKLEARISQNDTKVLYWIKEYFGGGVYKNGDKRAAERGWQTNHFIHLSYKKARIFLTAIEPFLKIKKDHVTALLDIAGREYMS